MGIYLELFPLHLQVEYHSEIVLVQLNNLIL